MFEEKELVKMKMKGMKDLEEEEGERELGVEWVLGKIERFEGGV